jgi:hypothetical protein
VGISSLRSIFSDFAFIPFEITRGLSCSEFVTAEMQLSCVVIEMEIGNIDIELSLRLIKSFF